MFKLDSHRVQPLPLQTQFFSKPGIAPVRQVTHERVAQRRKVHTDLVGASSLKIHFTKRGSGECLYHVVVGDRGSSVASNREFVVVPGMSADRSVDRARKGIRVALNQSVV